GIAVADPKRSIDFYQGLFGLPIVARQESTTILRVGAGPQFLAIAAVASGAAPSITHYCLGVENFNVDRLLATLAQHVVTKGADARGRSERPVPAVHWRRSVSPRWRARGPAEACEHQSRVHEHGRVQARRCAQDTRELRHQTARRRAGSGRPDASLRHHAHGKSRRRAQWNTGALLHRSGWSADAAAGYELLRRQRVPW